MELRHHTHTHTRVCVQRALLHTQTPTFTQMCSYTCTHSHMRLPTCLIPDTHLHTHPLLHTLTHFILCTCSPSHIRSYTHSLTYTSILLCSRLQPRVTHQRTPLSPCPQSWRGACTNSPRGAPSTWGALQGQLCCICSLSPRFSRFPPRLPVLVSFWLVACEGTAIALGSTVLFI